MHIADLRLLAKPARLFAAMVLFALVSGCGSQNTAVQGGTSAVDIAQPVRLYANGPGLAEENKSILMSVDAAAAKKAINNYRINKRGEQSPYDYRAADLNGDGKPELIVYFTGESWCAKTGCTLAVLQPGAYGYKPVTTIRRVKLPVRVRNESFSGWRTLVVNTGGAGMPLQTVALKFTGRGYPGNATTLAPIEQGGDMGVETLFEAAPAAPMAAAPAFQSAPKP